MAGKQSFEDLNLTSLYDLCIKAISYGFEVINVKFLKDLPRHILKDIIDSLNPLDLENVENEDFLMSKEISTNLLWKIHYLTRWKQVRNNVQRYNGNNWRTLYFQRHFHDLMGELSFSKDNSYVQILKDSLQSICRTNSYRQMTQKSSSSEQLHEMIDLCVKHLTHLRLSRWACVFLERHRDVAQKLAATVKCLIVQQLRDNGVETLSEILPVFLTRRVCSFSLLFCKVETEANLRVVLKVLSSVPLNTTISKQHESSNDYCEQGNGRPTALYGDSESELKEIALNEAIKHRNKDTAIAVNANYHNACLPDNHKCSETNSEMGVAESKNFNESKILHDSCEDDLYEEIFSGNLQFPDSPGAGDPISAMVNSLDSCSESSSHKCSKIISPSVSEDKSSGLKELELQSYQMSSACLKIFSEELRYFSCLETLKLSDTGSGFCPEMLDVFKTVKELVINGSLRNFVVENNTINDYHAKLLFKMVVGSCQKCKRVPKGLRSLRMVANGLEKTTIDFMAERLSNCSFCENRAWKPGGDSKASNPVNYTTCKCVKNTRPVSPNTDQSKIEKRSRLPSTSYTLERTNTDRSTHQKTTADGTNAVQNYITSASGDLIYLGIECLHLSTQITNGGAASLARSLLFNRSLRRLSLPSCGLRTDDIAVILDCISGCDLHEPNYSLNELDLRANSFDPLANESLCNLITRSRLVYLDLSFCGLEVIPDSVVLALCSNNTLEVLKIAGNRLGDEGVTSISHVFKCSRKKSMLSTLDLSYNRLTVSSLLHLGHVLATWPKKLCEISIKGNWLDDSQLVEVKNCLEKVCGEVLTQQFDRSGAYADYLSEM